MKFFAVLSLGAGLAAALPSSGISKRSGVVALDIPYKFVADKPANAPEGYETSVIFSTQKRSELPATFQRRQAPAQVSATDFFECANAVRLGSHSLSLQTSTDKSLNPTEPSPCERRLQCYCQQCSCHRQ